MPETRILSKPEIDLEIFYQLANKVVGRTVTKAIDSVGYELKEPAKFISALAEFADPEKNYKAGLNVQQADHELFFLHYVFICAALPETCKQIRERTKLDVTSQSSPSGATAIFLLGGSISEWVRATKECCSTIAGFDCRLLFDKIILLFEREGLGNLWFDQRKKTLDDQTFLLEDMT